mgnify:CR=1 FL=1
MRAGQTLTNGLDILITNLFIGGTEMGYISTSKTIVVAINTLYETIAAVFLITPPTIVPNMVSRVKI